MHRALPAEIRRRAMSAALALAATLILLPGCGAKAAPTSPPCDEKCQDGVVLRSLRELLKFAYNTTVGGQPVGHQDAYARGLMSGTIHVVGDVDSNADQGLTNVRELKYEISHCAFMRIDDTPNQSYDMVFDGTITQEGTIAVQPSAPTALRMQSDSITFSGTVYDPPLRIPPEGGASVTCALDVKQDGNNVSGKFCERNAGFDF